METVYSDFWMDVDGTHDDQPTEYLHLIRLAQYRKAISNFVNILTNKRIPVYFNTKNKNATDGEVVYLSPTIRNKKDFDVAVGLSLHEAAHIVNSDFLILKTLWQRTPRDIYDLAVKKNITKSRVAELVKTMLNYVEDRYIDSLVYMDAPGYRGYYISLYDRYFNLESNSHALKSNIYRFPSLAAYEFRIINFTNPATDLSALPGLDEIYNIIDIPTVLRLKTPNDRFDVAIKITKIILENLGKQKKGRESNGSAGDSKKNTKGPTEESDPSVEKNESKNTPDSDESPESNETENDDIGGNDAENAVVDSNKSEDQEDLESGRGDDSSVDVDKLNKVIERQKSFINGDVKKSTLKADEECSISSIDKSGMVLVRVGKSFPVKKENFKGIECVVVKKLTNELLDDSNFPMYTCGLGITGKMSLNEKSVSDGLIMGRMLGKRLQIRNEIKLTKYNRQAFGKIDRRLLSELGCGYENIFYTIKSDKFNKVFLHISVDASSSMAGKKWSKTLTCVVAICKATSMISNIHTTVSFRTTLRTPSGETPYVVLAYDSEKDSIKKVITHFKRLSPSNTTPEGLAFEAILDSLPPKKFGEDRYFLNFSDGQPCFSGDRKDPIEYIGEPAVEHTRTQVTEIRSRGYKILSYFIEPGGKELSEPLKKDFKKMYGKDASFVDVDNVIKVSNTLNAMFLKKD